MLQGPGLWEVVGGVGLGGILVRSGEDLTSPQTSQRLATRAVVSELKLVGERLNYKLVTGTGPDEGWVSLKLKGKDLVIEKVLSADHCCELQGKLKERLLAADVQRELDRLEASLSGQPEKHSTAVTGLLMRSVYPDLVKHISFPDRHKIEGVRLIIKSLNVHCSQNRDMAETWLELETVMRNQKMMNLARDLLETLNKTDEQEEAAHADEQIIVDAPVPADYLDEREVRIVFKKVTSKSVCSVMHIEASTDFTVLDLRHRLKGLVQIGAEILAEVMGSGMKVLHDSEVVPPTVWIAESLDEILPSMAITKKQAAEAQRMLKASLMTSAIQQGLNDLESETKGNQIQYRRKLKPFLVTEVYPALVAHFGMPELGGAAILPAAIAAHSNNDVQMIEMWLMLEKLMRNEAAVLQAESTIAAFRSGGSAGAKAFMSDRSVHKFVPAKAMGA